MAPSQSPSRSSPQSEPVTGLLRRRKPPGEVTRHFPPEGLTLGGYVAWQSETRSPLAGPHGEDAVQGAYTLVDLFGSYRVSDRLRVQVKPQ
jgi:outer membrane receptor for ferric coprogen and ferric-rhodotorulic acid